MRTPVGLVPRAGVVAQGVSLAEHLHLGPGVVDVDREIVELLDQVFKVLRLELAEVDREPRLVQLGVDPAIFSTVHPVVRRRPFGSPWEVAAAARGVVAQARGVCGDRVNLGREVGVAAVDMWAGVGKWPEQLGRVAVAEG
ncbi:MAG TPA: hypothetical protein VLH10_12090, partial [Yinghuangia sp.]|nr:hypothetical protein [Yinghuangia sp.]